VYEILADELHICAYYFTNIPVFEIEISTFRKKHVDNTLYIESMSA